MSTSEATIPAPRQGIWTGLASHIWPPALALYTLVWLLLLAMELSIIPKEFNGWDWLFEPGFFLKGLYTLVLWFSAGSLPVHDRERAGRPMKHNLIKWDGYRATLALFFFLLAWVLATAMIPLPDEPPRIQFKGVLCSSLGLVIAFHCLTSRSRLFLRLTWVYIIWLAFPQLQKRLKFLEMMLEPTVLIKVTSFSLGLVLITLLLPRALQTFDRIGSGSNPKETAFLKKGFPF